MTRIYVELVTKKIDCKLCCDMDKNTIERIIILKGRPKISGSHGKYTFLSLIKDKKKIDLPNNIFVKIYPINHMLQKQENQISYLEAQDPLELGDTEEPAMFYANIGVHNDEFNYLLNFSKCKNAKFDVILSFMGISVNDEIVTDSTGYEVTWDLEKSSSLNLDSFYFNTRINNNIKKVKSKIDEKSLMEQIKDVASAIDIKIKKIKNYINAFFILWILYAAYKFF